MAVSVDILVERAVAGIQAVTRRARQMTTWLLGIVATTSVLAVLLTTLLLPSAVLRIVYLVIAGGFAAVGIGAALIARQRFAAVHDSVPELAAELRSLATSSTEWRRFLEASVVTDPGGTERIVADLNESQEVAVGRKIGRLRGLSRNARRSLKSYAQVSGVMTAISSFPFLAAIALVIASGLTTVLLYAMALKIAF